MTGTIPAGPGQGPIPDPIQAGLARGWKVIDGAHQGAAADRGQPAAVDLRRHGASGRMKP
jgi:hypothetical protein